MPPRVALSSPELPELRNKASRSASSLERLAELDDSWALMGVPWSSSSSLDTGGSSKALGILSCLKVGFLADSLPTRLRRGGGFWFLLKPRTRDGYILPGLRQRASA